MIDSIVGVIDRIIKLIEHKNQRKERLFDEIVQPAFSLLEDIHKDYIDLFENTASRLSKLMEKRLIWIHEAGLPPIYLDNEEPFSEWTDDRSRVDPTSPAYQAAVELGLVDSVVEWSGVDDLAEMRTIARFLQERRREFEPVRVKLRCLITTARSAALPDNVRSFVDAVANYLPIAAPRDVRPGLEQFQPQALYTDERFGEVTVTFAMFMDQRFREEVERLSQLRYEQSLDAWAAIHYTDVPTRWVEILTQLIQILRYHREHWRTVAASFAALQFELKAGLSVKETKISPNADVKRTPGGAA